MPQCQAFVFSNSQRPKVISQHPNYLQSSPMAIKHNQVIIPNTQEPTKPLTLIAIHNSIKLTSPNYLSWKLQMESILSGYDLQEFIDESCNAPMTIIT